MLLFIDEAEAFLASRSNARLTEHMRNALNAFLYQTGGPTAHFILVLATNRASDLDEAVLDRTDEEIYFGLPAEDARDTLVALYYDRYLRALERKPGRARALWRLLRNAPAPLSIAAGVDAPATFARIAAQTDGFSGREIEKLFVAVQSVAYGSGAALDAATLLQVVANKCREHARKASMNAGDTSIRSPPNTPRSRLTSPPASPGRRR